MPTHTRAIIKDGTVINVVVAADDYKEGIPCGSEVGVGWGHDGTAFSPPPPAETPPPTIDDFRLAIQGHVDAIARGRNYDSGNSLASYVASTNAVWAAEAQAFVVWRDAVWLYAYSELDKVQTGAREVPTVEAFIGELPAIEWAT